MRRVLVGTVLTGVLCACGGAAQAAWPGQFADVDTWPKWGLYGERYDEETFAAWGGDLAEAVWWELMIGDPPEGFSTSPRMFRPYDTITRAEYAMVLARALGIEKKAAAGEVWFGPTVEELKQAGIITADGNFDAAITRREMGDWVGRALEWYGVDLDGKAELRFSDIDGLAEAPYIRLATRADVIKGYPDGTYGPEQTATRAEAAAMAVRLAKQLKKNPPGPEVFEQHYRDHMAAVTEGEKEVAQGKPYDHSHLLEPYLSEMVIYGYGGYDIGARFTFAFKKVEGYRKLVFVKSEPVLVRDTVALVRNTSSLRRVLLDGTEVARDQATMYSYYAKRNGAWIGMNSKEPGDYPREWLPKPEVAP